MRFFIQNHDNWHFIIPVSCMLLIIPALLIGSPALLLAVGVLSVLLFLMVLLPSVVVLDAAHLKIYEAFGFKSIPLAQISSVTFENYEIRKKYHHMELRARIRIELQNGRCIMLRGSAPKERYRPEYDISPLPHPYSEYRLFQLYLLLKQ